MDNSLQGLLELSRDPVLALADGCILMMNEEAKRRLPGIHVGADAMECFPALAEAGSAEAFLFGAAFGDDRYTVSARQCGGVLYLAFRPEPDAATLRGCLSDGLMNGMLNTLFGIGLAAERLKAQPDAEDAEDALSRLYHAYYSLWRRLNNLNALCCLSDGSMGVVPYKADLVELCSDLAASVSLLLSGRYARVEFRTELPSLPVVLDAPKVERLILNLLTNSLRHTPKGGTVALHLSRRGPSALLSVDDSGSGIPPEKLESVFHSFQDRMDEESLSLPPGDGLGLALCSMIAGKHGGALMLESREGVGTSVRIRLPVSLPERDDLGCKPETYGNGGMTVLLTELSELLDSGDYVDGFPE